MMDRTPQISCKDDVPSDPSKLERSSTSYLESESIASKDLIRIPETSLSDIIKQKYRPNASPTGFEHNPRIPLICLENVRGRLTHLIVKNRAMTAKLTNFRESIIRDLNSHFKIRHVAAGQLTRSGPASDIRDLCIAMLKVRRELVMEKQNDLYSVAEAIERHATLFEYSTRAFHEVLTNIHLLEANATTRSEYVGGRFPMDFPQMTALARLSAGEDYESIPTAIPKPLPEPQEYAKAYTPCFAYFSKFPVEVRLIIWKFSLPGQRIITHSPRHNKNISLLSACHESRRLVKSTYTRILSPTYKTTETNTEFIWVDLDNDIVVRDLSTPESDNPSKNLFDRPTTEFNAGCFRLFTGLAKVKHLAVAFDVLRQNGGSFFVALQACAPELESLTIMPSTQIDGSPLRKVKIEANDNIRLIELDSNVFDYVSFRRSRVQDRILKQKAYRGVSTLATYLNHSRQYKALFPTFVASSEGLWNPKISVAIVTTWNRRCKSWQTRHLDRDHYNGKYIGDDSRMYNGFVESLMMCSTDGEVLSRYDGIDRLFEEI
ncbi:hypothetical protein BKA65DRAFT_542656 [Rhexocercosporidium sp. MPI-PUGE-AT-0058]|nr:hypothetical protein BKA65DRAFT_542656 [Rhexocercosporidium sp. MPI-PUGE-AT-0058]